MKNLIIILIACLSLVSCTKEDLGLLRNTKNHNTNNGINGGINTTDYITVNDYTNIILDSINFDVTYETKDDFLVLYYSYINGTSSNSIQLRKTNQNSGPVYYNKLKINRDSFLIFNFELKLNGGKINDDNYLDKNKLEIKVTYKGMTFNVPKIFNDDGNLTLTLKASDLIYRNNNQK